MLVDRTRQGVHLSRKPHRASLIVKEASTMVPAEYADFANVFSSDLASKPPIYSLGLVGLSKLPAGARRQVGKGLILPEDFVLADASIGFHLQQCRHTICIRGTYSVADNQAGGTLERWPKGQIVAWSRKSRMSPSQ